MKSASSCPSQNVQVVENDNNSLPIEIENPFHFIHGVEGTIYFKCGF